MGFVPPTVQTRRQSFGCPWIFLSTSQGDPTTTGKRKTSCLHVTADKTLGESLRQADSRWYCDVVIMPAYLATTCAAGAALPCFTSNRSKFMTLSQAATKSWTNFSLASSLA
ncbi:hypothetical protein V7x_38040 [Crateriforma conspicua]|uniref:Uncharacterized protein n=1 Tax=Crateriforma conspicua TaxID=2527996 RepID=A0A5C6FII9_9PLAN|nr:hypothetical protein V7x_38040 [Crateriforma conspicua]